MTHISPITTSLRVYAHAKRLPPPAASFNAVWGPCCDVTTGVAWKPKFEAQPSEAGISHRYELALHERFSRTRSMPALIRRASAFVSKATNDSLRAGVQILPPYEKAFRQTLAVIGQWTLSAADNLGARCGRPAD